MRGVRVSYSSPQGHGFELLSPPGEGRRRKPVNVPENGLDGLVGELDFTTLESVTRYGARQVGFKASPVSFDLPVVVTNADKPLDAQDREWRQAWSPFKDGRLTVVNVAGQNRWTPVRLESMTAPPHLLHRKRSVEMTVSARAMSGCWFGATQKHTGDFGLSPTGDLPPVLKLRWDGVETHVTFPDGRSLNFPALGSERIINLDFGMAGQVTRPDGTVDTNVWSGLQGKVHGMSLAPHELTEWDLGPGMTLEVTPRYLSPWR